MPRDKIEELRNLPDVETQFNRNATRAPGSHKIGNTTGYYLYVDNDEIRLKSQGVGMIMTESQTTVQPGAALSYAVPYQLVDYNKMAFHPAADVPSDATFPHATFSPKYHDPTIKLVYGMYSALRALI